MSALNKLHTLDELAGILDAARSSGKRIVHCHGVFDLLHIGHIRHFNEAKKLGELLVVTLTADPFVNKGPNRPAFTQQLRAEAIASLECVDYVAINSSPIAEPAIRKIRPRFYVKGQDYRERPGFHDENLLKEKNAVEEFGGELIFTDDMMFSSSTLLNTHFSPFTQEVTDYLAGFKSRYDIDTVAAEFAKIRGLKVLVLGEAIIDEYRSCEVLGKAGRDPVLATELQSQENYLGGSLAVANHLADFCNEVGILTFLGSADAREEFVRRGLKPNIKPSLLLHRDRRTIVKRRYVDGESSRNIFEVLSVGKEPLGEQDETVLCAKLADTISDYDVVVATDHGHGFFTRKVIDLLTKKSKFLAVTTHATSDKLDFRTISIYPRADYIAISARDLVLDSRRNDLKVSELISELTTRVSCDRITVTKGKHGIASFLKGRDPVEAPRLSHRATTGMDPSDAILAVTSLFACLGAGPDLVAFIGNVAESEAMKTGEYGPPLEFESMKRHITALLK